jgi:hypothetical protein
MALKTYISPFDHDAVLIRAAVNQCNCTTFGSLRGLGMAGCAGHTTVGGMIKASVAQPIPRGRHNFMDRSSHHV